jgi:phosphohistidine phosphatase
MMDEKFPTAALAVMDFDISTWKDVAQDEGKIVTFTRPADLDD